MKIAREQNQQLAVGPVYLSAESDTRGVIELTSLHGRFRHGPATITKLRTRPQCPYFVKKRTTMSSVNTTTMTFAIIGVLSLRPKGSGRSSRCQSTPIMPWLDHGDRAGDSGRCRGSAHRLQPSARHRTDDGITVCDGGADRAADNEEDLGRGRVAN